jgi:hypothetical protein
MESMKGLCVILLLDSRAETWETKAVQPEAMFYCAGTDSVVSSPKAEP